jgi:hypothetical protein
MPGPRIKYDLSTLLTSREPKTLNGHTDGYGINAPGNDMDKYNIEVSGLSSLTGTRHVSEI